MVRRLNHHRPIEQNHKLESRKEPSLAVIVLSLHVSTVRVLVVAFGSVE